MYTPKLEDFMKALADNRVFSCEDEHFIGFKYNAPTVYSRDWDDVTLNARGIVFDKATGEIVARPFYKFFNYEELFDGEGKKSDIMTMMALCGFKFDLSYPFRVMDKLDGSLGILFYDKYADKWRVKTGGSFNSDQAAWAQKWTDEHIIHGRGGLVKGHTYCYEILCNSDVHPISYDKEEMVLLGALSNKTGEEYTTAMLRCIAEFQGVRCADFYEFETFDDVIPFAKSLPSTKEGVVVTFANGFKVKIKGHEFLALQKKFHNITQEYIWQNYNVEDPVNPFSVEFATSIPEEMQDMHNYMKQLTTDIRDACSRCVEVGSNAYTDHSDSRKDAYEFVARELEDAKRLIGPTMKLYSALSKGNPKEGYDWTRTELVSSVHKMLKP